MEANSPRTPEWAQFIPMWQSIHIARQGQERFTPMAALLVGGVASRGVLRSSVAFIGCQKTNVVIAGS